MIKSFRIFRQAGYRLAIYATASSLTTAYRRICLPRSGSDCHGLAQECRRRYWLRSRRHHRQRSGSGHCLGGYPSCCPLFASCSFCSRIASSSGCLPLRVSRCVIATWMSAYLCCWRALMSQLYDRIVHFDYVGWSATVEMRNREDLEQSRSFRLEKPY